MAFEICNCPLAAVQKVGFYRVEGSTSSTCLRYVVGSGSIPSVTSRSHLSASFRSSKLSKTGVLGGMLVRHKSVRAETTRKGDHGFFCLQTRMGTPCGDQIRPGERNGVLENWLQRYVTEIVRHLPEAPFMQLVKFGDASEDLDEDRHKLSVELFDKPQSWGPVKQFLRDSAPDGIILVQRLNGASFADCCSSHLNENFGACSCSRESSCSDASSHSGAFTTDVWGLLVQGYSVQSSGTACYILKTTRVASSSGILTHFCVSRAKSCELGPSLQSQIESMWLL